jgi:hypothetical protein
MMMDGKGCALIVGLLAAIGFVIGLLLHWTGLLPWWAPLVGLGLPVAAALLLGLWLILGWMANGSH